MSPSGTAVVPALSDEQADSVRDLVRRWRERYPDDSPPLSERAMLALDHPGRESDSAAAAILHAVVTEESGAMVGYAQFTPEDDGYVIELVTAVPAEPAETAEPEHAVADALLAAGIASADRGPVLLWAHGDDSPVHAAAERAGFVATRALLQLRLPLAGWEAGATHAGLPPGVELRNFRPGVDDAGWLGVNARAFAHHPEQGSWTQADLDARRSTDWFDPADFLLAVRDGEIIGFHWMKRHDAQLGEVYVLGVDPAAQTGGLGTALLLAGLEHLRAEGITTVLLYVDEENGPAVRLYRRMGFTLHTTDTRFARD